ncbi:rhodanese-like domain-containing protein [Mycolicibacterium goodii]|uniref:Rhodanese-like domain-containing protein n=1 Tax=Mycolicibacterium goodii TaxID=134601 RepID=A0ABS6HNC2_MYCGD|nr:rhodanese-like domain-containing protein [Mycolicibacterium goodii]MBU8822757.1 rhodanese-like domain-containing protein [Mycolicibacterium goodii]MBU8838851.1 rhodanese-like domain-containing protein [Mycolicibacterium goodii]
MRPLHSRSVCGVAAGALLLVGLTGCAAAGSPTTTQSAVPPATASAPHQARSVAPQQFDAFIAERKRVTINVHVPYEGDIAGTDLSIPFDQIPARADALPPERTTPLAVYCRSGRMSQIAATALSRMGYQDVVELDGGMLAWEKSGRTLVWR